MKSIWNRTGIIFILFVSSFANCWSHDGDGHDRELREVLFGENAYRLSEQGELYFRLLCEASYLTLDLYNTDSKGKLYIDDLRKNGVKNLPSIESIMYNSNSLHGRYTHLGWEHNYVVDKANWKARKTILLETVKRIGNFKDNERIKLDAFAALVYEIHVLGDHIGDSDYSRYTRIRLVSEPDYKGQEVSPTSDGPFNNPTLYIYFLYHIQRLFREQKTSYEFTQMIGFLNRHKNQFVSSKERPVPYDDIQFLAKKTKQELVRYLPTLLVKERFFKEAFYK